MGINKKFLLISIIYYLLVINSVFAVTPQDNLVFRDYYNLTGANYIESNFFCFGTSCLSTWNTLNFTNQINSLNASLISINTSLSSYVLNTVLVSNISTVNTNIQNNYTSLNTLISGRVLNSTLNSYVLITDYDAGQTAQNTTINTKIDSTYGNATYYPLNTNPSGYLTGATANLTNYYNKTEIDASQLAQNVTINSKIDSVYGNATYLLITDQRYNDSVRINALNISKYDASNPLNFINDSSSFSFNSTNYYNSSYINSTYLLISDYQSHNQDLNTSSNVTFVNVNASSGVFTGVWDVGAGADDFLNYGNVRLGTDDNNYGGRVSFEYDHLATNTLWQIDNGGDSLRFFNHLAVYGLINTSGFYTTQNIGAGNTIYEGGLSLNAKYNDSSLINAVNTSLSNYVLNTVLNSNISAVNSNIQNNYTALNTLISGRVLNATLGSYALITDLNSNVTALNTAISGRVLNATLGSYALNSVVQSNYSDLSTQISGRVLNATLNNYPTNSVLNSNISGVNSNIQNNYTNLNDKISNVNSTVSTHTSQISGIQSNVSALQSANVSANARIDALNSTKLIDVTSANTYISVSGTLNKTLTFSESVLNDTIDNKLLTTYFNVSNVSALTGTLSGNLSFINVYDGVSFNISEVNGDIDAYINFTGVTDFNQIIIRYATIASEPHTVKVYLYEYGSNAWESYTTLGSTTGIYVVETIGVFDADEHISSDGNVSIRLVTTNIGVNTHAWRFDWVSISDGFATPSGSETDPFSIYKDGTIPLTANWDAGSFNITASYFLGNLNASYVLNPYWLNLSDQRYNDTALINAVNSSLSSYVLNSVLVSNISALNNSLNTSINNEILARQSLGNWSSDKPSYVSQTYGNSTYARVGFENTFLGQSNFNNSVMFYNPVYFFNNVTLSNTNAMKVNSSIIVTDISGTPIFNVSDVGSLAKLWINGLINTTGIIYEGGLSLNTKYNDSSLINAVNTSLSGYVLNSVLNSNISAVNVNVQNNYTNLNDKISNVNSTVSTHTSQISGIQANITSVNATANLMLPKSGGTMTGNITLSTDLRIIGSKWKWYLNDTYWDCYNGTGTIQNRGNTTLTC